MYGLIAYAVTYTLYSAVGYSFSPLLLGTDDAQSLFIKQLADEVIISIPVAVALSIMWLYIANKKVTARILHKIGATKTYGDEDVWDFTFNSRDASVEYIHFKDLENNFIYAGWVNTFSQSGQQRELLLRDVKVYTLSTAEELYEVPYLYIARNKEHILVEFPHTTQSRGSS